MKYQVHPEVLGCMNELLGHQMPQRSVLGFTVLFLGAQMRTLGQMGGGVYRRKVSYNEDISGKSVYKVKEPNFSWMSHEQQAWPPHSLPANDLDGNQTPVPRIPFQNIPGG